MHENTTKLIQLMSEYKVTSKEVAELLQRSYQTVLKYRCKHNGNTIPTSLLELLELKLKARKEA
jgi:predicted DNA-binding protein (MmcQ/YjbR family)